MNDDLITLLRQYQIDEDLYETADDFDAKLYWFKKCLTTAYWLHMALNRG